jgi:type I restriction enzyme, S subunit
MTDWSEKELGEILTLNYGWSLPKKKRVAGSVPVYGSNGIVGHHNEPLVDSLGLIVGRKGSAGNVHFSRIPFCPIDTTFYIAPDDTALDIEFLYYLLLHIDLKRILGDVGVPGLNREIAYKERAQFPETRDEQRKIAAVLGLVQRAIEQQERLLALTTELKKALLQKLFTEGLRGEPQKQTEIGPVPKSWEIKKLGSLVHLQTGKLNSNAATPNGQYPFFTCSQETFRIDHYAFDTEAILLSGNNAQGIYSVKHYNGKFNAYQRTYVITVKAGSGVPYPFLHQALSRNLERLRTLSIGTSTKYLTLGVLQNLPIPKPGYDEAKGIGDRLQIVDAKIEIVTRKKETLANLFRTLLFRLMTAQIRVNDLDLVLLCH